MKNALFHELADFHEACWRENQLWILVHAMAKSEGESLGESFINVTLADVLS